MSDIGWPWGTRLTVPMPVLEVCCHSWRRGSAYPLTSAVDPDGAVLDAPPPTVGLQGYVPLGSLAFFHQHSPPPLLALTHCTVSLADGPLDKRQRRGTAPPPTRVIMT